jgi:hypothetical protein
MMSIPMPYMRATEPVVIRLGEVAAESIARTCPRKARAG